MVLQTVPPARNGVPGDIDTAPTQPIVEPPPAAAFETPPPAAFEPPPAADFETPPPAAFEPPSREPFQLAPEDVVTPPPPTLPVATAAGPMTTTPEAAATPPPATTATTVVRPAPPAQPLVDESSLRDPVQQLESHEVEHHAKSLAAEKTDFTDNLKHLPFPRLLQRLYARRATGSLLLLHGGTKKIVSFVEGYPVAVRSNLLSECLGQILLSQKMISPQVLAESVRRMQKEKRRQGEILVEMGALSRTT